MRQSSRDISMDRRCAGRDSWGSGAMWPSPWATAGWADLRRFSTHGARLRTRACARRRNGRWKSSAALSLERLSLMQPYSGNFASRPWKFCFARNLAAKRFPPERKQIVAELSNTDAQNDTTIEAPRASDVPEPAKQSKWYRWRKDGTALVHYLLDSEVHTFAFSVAANAILSFIPFIVLLYTLSHSVFHSKMMIDVVNAMVYYFFPSNQDFVARNLALVALG